MYGLQPYKNPSMQGLRAQKKSIEVYFTINLLYVIMSISTTLPGEVLNTCALHLNSMWKLSSHDPYNSNIALCLPLHIVS